MSKTLGILLAVAILSFGQGGSRPETALRAAMELETVKGDLRGAIQQYAKLAQAKDRAIAATALLRMAQCHEKLGNEEARRIYERLVREFAEQTAAVAEARTRLGATQRATRDRVVWSGKNLDHVTGNISPDGRWVCYTDFWFTGNLMAHDLVSGVDRSLTPDENWSKNGNAEGGAFSPDSQSLAYGWLVYSPRHIEIRILRPGDSGVPKHTMILSDADIAHLSVMDWSSDGNFLAVSFERRDRITRLGLVRVKDGQLQELRQVPWRGPTRVEFSPDGRYLAYDQPASETARQRDLHLIRIDGSGETTVESNEANDVLLGWSHDGGALLFRSNRGGTEGLYSLPIHNGAAAGGAKLLKPDVGPMFALGRTATGSLYLYKDTSTTGLYTAPIDLVTGRLTGSPAVENYRSRGADWSRDGRLLAYGIRSDGANYLAVRNLETGVLKKLPTQMNFFTELRFSPDGKTLAAGAREVTGRAGLYRFDAETGATAHFADGSHTTRVQFSPDGTKVYHTASNPSRIVELDPATGKKRDIVAQIADGKTSTREISPDGRFLAGIMSDEKARRTSIVLIPVDGGEIREVVTLNLPEAFEPYSFLAWTPDSKAVVAAKLTGERKEFWLIPMQGGPPRKLDWTIPDFIGGLRIHPSGRKIAFEAGVSSQEIWAIEITKLTEEVQGR